MKIKLLTYTIASIMLSACGGSSQDQAKNNPVTNASQSSNNSNREVTNINCIETGAYACKTGRTEPLYTFQWALNYQESFFKKFKSIWKNDADPQNYDLNVENLHRQGIKGQGINIIILDDGIDIKHEDLSSNIKLDMTYNFQNRSNDPTPPLLDENKNDAHGTNVAGIIAAAQNGKGIMGIASRANLGGANYISTNTLKDTIAAYGGAPFSQNVDIFNASFGRNPITPPSYNDRNIELLVLRNLQYLRQNKGAILLKAAGNEFIADTQSTSAIRDCLPQFQNILSCENPAHEIQTLEPTTIIIAAANTKGIKASYSNAGAVNWVTGLAGESGLGGEYGEGVARLRHFLLQNHKTQGPSIFSTDLQGCVYGYSRSDSTDNLFSRGLSKLNGILNNAKCDYSQMNGTSAATPSVSAVTALILQVNPNLTWRDVREILKRTSRKIDLNYVSRSQANRLVDLKTGLLLNSTGTKNDIKDGATQVSLEFGWQTNNAGSQYSNWYGFGLVDATAAVELAKTYKAGTLPSRLQIPQFSNAFPNIHHLNYGQVTRLGIISMNQGNTIDQFQLRLSGPICAGSVGIFVKSPSGIISTLSIPYNIYYKSGISKVQNYSLGSYAFHDEKANGQWEIFAISGDKGTCTSEVSAQDPLKVEYRVIPKTSS